MNWKIWIIITIGLFMLIIKGIYPISKDFCEDYPMSMEECKQIGLEKACNDTDIMDYYTQLGGENTLKNVVSQIKLRGNGILITIDDDLLVCNLVIE